MRPNMITVIRTTLFICPTYCLFLTFMGAEILLAYNPVRALTDPEIGESLAAYAYP